MGRQKELAGLNVPDAIERARKLGLQPISPKTINDGYLIHAASMFNWARKEQWITSNPFEGLSVFDPVSDQDRRDPFTVPQLTTLFATAPWDRPWAGEDKRAGAYWVADYLIASGLADAHQPHRSGCAGASSGGPRSPV